MLLAGRGATFDLYPSKDVGAVLEHFWAKDKVVGAICHGAIALGNIPERIKGKRTTGYTLEGDKALQEMFGSGFLIPHYPQTVLEETGSHYSRVGANDPYVIRDGKLVTGQNQQSRLGVRACAAAHDDRRKPRFTDLGRVDFQSRKADWANATATA